MATTTKTHFKRPRLVRTSKRGRYPSEGDRLLMSSCCPGCAQPCDEIYLGSFGQELGCNVCITEMSIHDYMVKQLEHAGKDITDEDLMTMSSQCPCCDRDCESVYVNDHSQALGCNLCVTTVPIFSYRTWKANQGGGYSGRI